MIRIRGRRERICPVPRVSSQLSLMCSQGLSNNHYSWATWGSGEERRRKNREKEGGDKKKREEKERQKRKR